MNKPLLPVHDHTDHGIRILEEVRRRIARDLHDGPAQMLTNINMKLDIIEMMIDMNPEMAKTQVKDLQKQVTSAVNEIHHLIYDLRPIAVDQVGFVEATKALCRQCESNWHIPIVLTVQEDLVSQGIDPAKQVALYRLIQEILNNIKKHAKAKNIEVTFLHEDSNLIIIIKDDGIGFDPTNIPPGHYGIIGMKEHAAYLGGSLNIESVEGNGSTFTIRVPVYHG